MSDLRYEDTDIRLIADTIQQLWVEAESYRARTVLQQSEIERLKIAEAGWTHASDLAHQEVERLTAELAEAKAELNKDRCVRCGEWPPECACTAYSTEPNPQSFEKTEEKIALLTAALAEAGAIASYQVAVEWRDKCRAAEAGRKSGINSVHVVDRICNYWRTISNIEPYQCHRQAMTGMLEDHDKLQAGEITKLRVALARICCETHCSPHYIADEALGFPTSQAKLAIIKAAKEGSDEEMQ